MYGNFEMPEAVRMYHEVIYGFDPAGDPTWPLRSARDVHVKVVRTLMKSYGAQVETAAMVSLCVWFESWRRSDVLEETKKGHRLSHVLKLMQMCEDREVPATPDHCQIMKWITTQNLRNKKSLLEETEVERVLFSNVPDENKNWVMLELQNVLATTGDEAFIFFEYIYI